jgi:Protein of unknown function (DUF2927)
MQAKIISALTLITAGILAAHAEPAEIGNRRAAEHKTFTDAQIIDGFFKVGFGAEFRVSGISNRIRKYDGPVRVFIDSLGKPDRSDQMAAVIADIERRVQHLDIARTQERSEANILVTLVRDRDLTRTVAQIYGRERARQIERKLGPQCLSSFRKDESFRITQSRVLLVVDAGDFVFRDCAYEELLQALGPINDTSAVPWTMFNDKVHMGYFDIYDQHLLNILYDPRIRPGMTVGQVTALLPQVLPDVRAWVAKVNGPGR